MILIGLAAAAAQASAVDAERAFADMAQKQGQWTAFRAFAAPEALMFVPEPKNAQDWLKNRKDPPASVHWWPARSWVSCDGAVAVNMGPALYGTKGHGTFTTVWKRQADGGWKWVLDQGHQLPKALPAAEKARLSRASCKGRPNASLVKPRNGLNPTVLTDIAPATDYVVLEEGRLPAANHGFAPKLAEPIASGSSPDRTLHWQVRKIDGGAAGARALHVFLWDGRAHRLHLTDIHEGSRK